MKLSPSFVPVEKLSLPSDDGLIRYIVEGENLRVLRAFEPFFSGKIKCIYIDPPYNNGESYLHYDDTTSGAWLDKLIRRLKYMRTMLTEDGSIWISIDDREVHYLKVEADKVFGRGNFITTIVWQQRTTRENRKAFSNNHEYILVYAKHKPAFVKTINGLPAGTEVLSRYKNPDDDPRGPWQSVSANAQAGHAVRSQFYEIHAPSGAVHYPPNGRCWVYNKSRMLEEIKQNNIWFGRDGKGVPRLKKFLADAKLLLTPETLWLAEDVGTSKEAKKLHLLLFPDHPVFDTVKPEALLRRILHIAARPGDLIMDAYLGTGTTVAVAHRMGLQYIGIDSGRHLSTFCTARLAKIVEGWRGGIGAEVGWNGGGGYSYFKYQESADYEATAAA